MFSGYSIHIRSFVLPISTEFSLLPFYNTAKISILWGMTAEPEMSLAQRVAAIRESDIGENLTDDALEHIAAICNLLSLSTGEVLTEEGAEGHHAYIILSGKIEVQICSDDNANPMGTRTLHPGAIIGEMSILESSKRTARTFASEPATLLCMYDEELWTLFDSDPSAGYQFMRNLARILSRRLRMTNLAIRHSFFMD